MSKPTIKSTLKRSFIISACIIGFIFVGCLVTLYFNQDFKQRWSRKSIEHSEGNYTVVYDAGGTTKTWSVVGGKITSEPDKGYYFFYATVPGNGKKIYVQVPIDRTWYEQVLIKRSSQ